MSVYTIAAGLFALMIRGGPDQMVTRGDVGWVLVTMLVTSVFVSCFAPRRAS